MYMLLLAQSPVAITPAIQILALRAVMSSRHVQ